MCHFLICVWLDSRYSSRPGAFPLLSTIGHPFLLDQHLRVEQTVHLQRPSLGRDHFLCGDISQYHKVEINTNGADIKLKLIPILDEAKEDRDGKETVLESCVFVRINAILAKLITVELNCSLTFQKSFIHYMNHKHCQYKVNGVQSGSRNGCSGSHGSMSTHIVLVLEQSQKLTLDYKWNYRIFETVMKAIQLDDAMNWLNTLGGGYSALGDHSKQHARQAGMISFRQLHIGMEMGDDGVVTRCYLYYALSLMQTGRLCEAKHIIRSCYQRAQSLLVSDTRLLAMCQGIWSRLRYLYKHKPRQNTIIYES